jgi:photosystem II stability/assembly factor-like uncharacterized protein
MAGALRLYAGTQEGLFIWRSQGGGWNEVGRRFAGAVIDSIAGSERDPARVLVGVAHDGLYGSEDAGLGWRKLLDGDIRAVSVDPADDRVVYAGTEPVRLYRSEDGGRTWEEIEALLDLPAEVRKKWTYPRPPHQGHVRQIFVHPQDSALLYLCLEHGGVVRSFDRGESWEDVSGGIDYPDIHAIANLPGRRDRYYLATARGFFTADDPARGWARAEAGLTRDYFHDLLFVPPERDADPPIMVIATADKSPGFWAREKRGARAAIFRSLDGARSWQRVTRGLADELDPMVWSIVRHPYEKGALFAGLGQVARGHAHGEAMAPRGAVLESRDRGESWEPLPLELPADRVLWAAAEA